ncbi:DNA-binding protein WhiA [Corynebacterium sp. HMSC05H05]|uniref:DNA-binding protein WhiA n=1 Tax=unclassified Corynebacterium TaxID=2624378 RepID=UPI0008A3C155|nr:MULTISPECIES: DNA-binding protein WhiA [unclassified Corynebacterium]OFT58501.1 DNA-binding protein WhiA [Corynebacterium sp. HMSC05H05]OHR22319.1 DNA-binding protein WhiA [Corynebacterium sp. HMSC034A01]
MALTAKVKDELLRATGGGLEVRAAEATALIRFGGEFQPSEHGVSIVADFEEEAVARRLAGTLTDLCAVEARVELLSPSSGNRETRYEVRVDDGAADVIRRLKLVTASGHPVVGMPRQIISGDMSWVEAAWRGAFLARGRLAEPGRTATLEVACPGQEAALALVGLARRMGLTAKTRETRGIERVTLRDGEAIGILLSRMGAPATRIEWDTKRESRAVKAKANSRLATFDDANTRRSAQAAAAAAARVERAMEILGDDVPEHLAEAGFLRVEHRHASLEELGRLADPQMTKDAVAGRIRRLLSLADKRAAELGVEDTHGSPTT